MGIVAMKPVDMRDILGVKITALTQGMALALVHDHILRGQHLKLAFCNAHTANLVYGDNAFWASLGQFTVLADGVGVDMASRLFYGSKFPANLNGTDFVPHLLRTSPKGLRIMLLGSRSGVVERAASQLRAQMPQHQVDVLHHGFFDEAQEAALLRRLEHDRPDVLLVALGNPLQEQWIARHCNSRNCGVAIGVGALFDFLAGEVRRAPAFVRRTRLEWLWRLMLEPARLFRRYVLGNPLFLYRVALAWLRRARPQPAVLVH